MSHGRLEESTMEIVPSFHKKVKMEGGMSKGDFSLSLLTILFF